ncbi:CheR family methyltransferase [Desulfonatronovibrio magnus]|uniref:CheR family methyltransferase n=1 Tax=Desulfonatronovibrio magnus TaxID=698827 RepID=UPI0005EBB714|nr:protein-glutamate O-methyltransferase CheR [Desulfonatronovibrio magnus]
MSETTNEVRGIEIALLLEGIYRRYGYDFRDYARCSIQRRLEQFLEQSSCSTFSEVTSRVLRDVAFFHGLLPYFSVSFTSLFREPSVFRALRDEILPVLRTWPYFKIWHAGCATGEEVYSLAILLREAGLLERATIFATDISRPALDTAREGVYSLEAIRRGGAAYQEAGGQGSLSEHYHARYNAAVMAPALRRKITFARHNLAMDSSFGEMQLILCRNVLIYFNQELHQRTLELFWESLDRGGFLCLGDKESLGFSAADSLFTEVNAMARIYKKAPPAVERTSL